MKTQRSQDKRTYSLIQHTEDCPVCRNTHTQVQGNTPTHRGHPDTEGWRHSQCKGTHTYKCTGEPSRGPDVPRAHTTRDALGHQHVHSYPKDRAHKGIDTSRKQPKTEAHPDTQKVPQINQEIHPQDYTQRHKSKNPDMPRETHPHQVTDTRKCVCRHTQHDELPSPRLWVPLTSHT